MKPFTRSISLFFVIVSVWMPLTRATGQQKQTSKLEDRVGVLEQRVKFLEARLLMMFGGKQSEARRVRSMMTGEINNISFQALQYFRRPASQNGGAGTFIGFSLAPKLAQTDIANYSVTPGDTDVIIEGKPIMLDGKIKTRVNSSGRSDNWTFTGDLLEAGNRMDSVRTSPEVNWDVIRGEARRILENASEYRRRAHSLGGGGGSYAGYAIPQTMASSNFGLYAILRGDSIIVLEVRPKVSNTMAIVTGDSAANVKTWSNIFALAEPKKALGGSKTLADSVRESITVDFVAIAARAYQYKIRPSSVGGGSGKYSGYLSAQASSFDGTTRYELQVDPDFIVLRASSLQGLGSASTKLDGNGKLSGWYYTGKLAE